MKASRWERLKSLYESAMDLTAVRRRAYLEGLMGSGTSSDLRRLVAEQDKLDGFLEKPAFVLRSTQTDDVSVDHEKARESVDQMAGGTNEPQPEHRDDETTTATLRAFSAGEVVAERFRIIRFIAHGGMGDVYEAEDLAQSRRPRVALKTVRPEIAANKQIARQFEREIEIGKTITHPNVCRIYDLGLHRDLPDAAGIAKPPIMFLTMELLNGKTLAEHLRHTKLMQPSEALPILQQVSDGLAAAHQAHVVHRDLKLGNIMLVSGRGHAGVRAVITDFGLARELADPDFPASLTELGAGTPDYMSPEQVSGKALGQASDLYSLGVVAYRMVTGKLPFEGEHARVRMIKRLHEPPVPPRTYVPSLPESWQSALLRCLEREPANRFATTPNVIRALEDYSEPSRPVSTADEIPRVLGAEPWLDRTGRSTPLPIPDADYEQAEVSPDGHKLAIVRRDEDGRSGLWIYDLKTGSWNRLLESSLPNSPRAVWSADGASLIANSERQNGDFANLIEIRLASPHLPQRLTEQPDFGQMPQSWSAKANALLFMEGVHPGTQADILVLPLSGGRVPRTLVATPGWDRAPAFSPDGRWFVYQSDYRADPRSMFSRTIRRHRAPPAPRCRFRTAEGATRPGCRMRATSCISTRPMICGN